MKMLTPIRPVTASVSCFRDTCNVYVLRSGSEAIAIDWGSGAVLDRLEELGVERITDILVTHHHGDQVQGLARAAAAGVRIWVPPVERALIEDADRYWRTASSRTTTTSVKIGRGARGGSGSRSRSRRTTR